MTSFALIPVLRKVKGFHCSARGTQKENIKTLTLLVLLDLPVHSRRITIPLGTSLNKPHLNIRLHHIHPGQFQLASDMVY